ncbi:MAG: nitrogen fixation protein NifQ [Rhodospirillales bacterium]
MGLLSRSDVSRLLHRPFEPLAQRNNRDMKWKKFFYRELCLRDNILICKAPSAMSRQLLRQQGRAHRQAGAPPRAPEAARVSLRRLVVVATIKRRRFFRSMGFRGRRRCWRR